MNSEQAGASQYERLVEVMAELSERVGRVVGEAAAQSKQGRPGSAADAAVGEAARPKLVFVYGETDGQSRRTEAFLAQVLQRRHNHETFELVRVCAESEPEFVEQLGVTELPTLLVLDEQAIQARLTRPGGARQIAAVLRPWLS